jgi:hypothetical protein
VTSRTGDNVLLSRKIGKRVTTGDTGSWRSLDSIENIKNVRNMEKFLEENAHAPDGTQPILARETMA